MRHHQLMDKCVAIVAYSFRFPGTNIHTLWTDLIQQKDCITQVDAARWSKDAFLHPDKRHAGTSYSFAAGSLGDISGFDAGFFGISPREAAIMDPQQRLLLEMAWETFENAGIAPASLRGSDCGVFVGISNVDYAYRLADDFASINSSAATGTISSIAANRISYLFDLHGPSIAMDTACSSSLVAFHQACQAIRSGEISQALAGGINLHLHPFGFLSFSKATMLSKTGRCHVFDESGDGYVRSEGGGLFLLKDYEQALADGDNILAVVAASAVNTDGNKSGLTIPNVHAQQALMTNVYKQAGIDPDTIDYFEAHGTGTAVGDPIETHAIGLALGQKRKKPLLIGSVKSNLGHLESASGVAGLAKALLCIQHRAVPATRGITQLNSHIDFKDWNLEVVTDTTPLKASGTLTVGINSFGFGGANAHVILQSPKPVKAKRASVKSSTLPLVFSAKNATALYKVATDLADFLETAKDKDFYNIAYSAAFKREQHSQAAVVFADNASEAIIQLRAFAEQNMAITHKVYTGAKLADAGELAFIYSGNGCQWQGMGKQLLANSAVFRNAVIEVDKLFSQYADFSLVDELAEKNGTERYQDTTIAQPALFALQVGITELLKAHGIKPIAVAGHSVGEVAAAYCSGALPLAEAVKVIYYRSHYQGQTKGLGGMTAVGLGAEAIKPLLAGIEDLELAGINSCKGTTVAGTVAALTELETQLQAQNIFFRRLAIDYAFHSAAMDSIEIELQQALAKLKTKTPEIAFYSTVTGELGATVDGAYWWHNVRQPVLFEQAINSLLDSGVNRFIEIGAHPVLQSYLRDALKATDTEGAVIATLSRNNTTDDLLNYTLAQTLISGDASALTHYFPVTGEFIALPNYPWQRESYWHSTSSEAYGLLNRVKVHPLLGYKLPQTELSWENQLDTQLQPYLADHNVGGAVVFAGAGFVEVALAAAHEAHNSEFIALEELEIRAPLLLSADSSKVIRLVIEASDQRFTLKSRELTHSGEWALHIVGRILTEATAKTLTRTIAPQIPTRQPDFTLEQHNALTRLVGLEYGEAFQAVTHGWLEGNTALGLFTTPESIAVDVASYYLHPSFLDCAFQLVFQLLKDALKEHDEIAFVPIKVGQLHCRASKALPFMATATLLHRSPHSLNAQFSVFDEQGNTIAVLHNVRFRAVKLHKHQQQHLSYLHYSLTAEPLTLECKPRFATLTQDLQDAIASEEQQQRAERYSGAIEPLLDSLSTSFLNEALSSLADTQGFIATEKLSDNATAQTLIAQALEAQLITETSGGWQQTAQDEISASAIWNTLIQDYADYSQLIALAGRVGLHLPELLNASSSASALHINSALYASLSSLIIERTSKSLFTQVLQAQCLQAIKQLAIGERLSLLEISWAKPEFAGLLCAQLDNKHSDYRFASYCDDALAHAENLRERFPLLQITRLNEQTPTTNLANVAIVTLNSADVAQLQSTLQGLPNLLQTGSTVLFIGVQAAQWLDNVLGIEPSWWLNNSRSPQLSAEAIAEQLQQLGFEDLQTIELLEDSNSGVYALIANSPANNCVVNETPAQDWLVLSSDKETALAQTLSDALTAQGQRVTLSQTVKLAQSYDHIIHLAGFASDDFNVQNQRCYLASELVRQCESSATPVTLWLITHKVANLFSCDQALAFADNQTQLAHDSALWGYGRTLINEASNYKVQLLDLSEPSISAAFINELL
ncbi:MAG: type I polyketide synthase, partial [Methylococcaceae bacterium]